MAPTVEVATGDELAAARRLQAQVMRPDGPLPTDREPSRECLDLVVRDHDAAIIGSALIGPTPWPRPDLAALKGPTWQLRRVAVLPAHRGQGAGRLLVLGAVETAVARGAASLWGEARVRAIPLYVRVGWTVVGPAWDKPGVGLHRYIWIAPHGDDGTDDYPGTDQGGGQVWSQPSVPHAARLPGSFDDERPPFGSDG